MKLLHNFRVNTGATGYLYYKAS